MYTDTVALIPICWQVVLIPLLRCFMGHLLGGYATGRHVSLQAEVTLFSMLKEMERFFGGNEAERRLEQIKANVR